MDPFKILSHGVKFDNKKFHRDLQKFKKRPKLEKNEDDTIIQNETKKMKLDSEAIRNENNILVDGCDIKNLIASFQNINIAEWLKENLRNNSYIAPTPIQMQVIPLLLDRRNMISCAPTGSGKTLSFIVPIINHLKAPKKLGFRAIILAPTRELVKQIHRECILLAEGSGLRIHMIKNTNLASKKFNVNSSLFYDILITTPQRLQFLLTQNPPAINIENLEWLIIDECDRLFERTFRDQLSSIFTICNKSKAKLTNAMFSATYDSNLEKWCKLNLEDVVTVIVGGKNRIAETVEQELKYVATETGKLFALKDIITNGCHTPVIIFVNKIKKANFLKRELLSMNILVDTIHADKNQEYRDEIVRNFREGKLMFLICSELMSRGIDFKAVNLVINYDLPSTSYAYIHHIGRTGRAGRNGKAITFYTDKDEENLCSILNIMKNSGCEVPDHLKEFNKTKVIQFREMEKKLSLKKKLYAKKRNIS